MTLDPTGRPRPFQETASRTATHVGPDAPAPPSAEVVLVPFFFDLLHVDGVDLIDLPLSERLTRLDDVVPADHRVARATMTTRTALRPSSPTRSPPARRASSSRRSTAPYDAGRRGSAWVKVKPRHTLDLVVLAVEWGSGRRRAGSPTSTWAPRPRQRRLRMLGNTFKGMTDEMLAWQTERFLELEDRAAHVVSSGRNRSWRSPSTASSVSRATRAGWRCASPGCFATAATRPRPRRTPSRPSAASPAPQEG